MKKPIQLLYVLIAMVGVLLSVPASAQSSSSDIVTNTGYTYSSNVDYTSYIGSGIVTMTTGNSLGVGEFTIRDGGGSADGDGNATTLTDLTLDFSFPEYVYVVGIFDGGSLVEQRYQNPTFPDTLQFHNLGLAAPDDGSKTFEVRVMFVSDVTDNDRLVVTIDEATAAGGGSTFASANAGGASTSTTNDDNRIEVDATMLDFTTQPSDTAYRGLVLGIPPVVSAIDANNNTDLDFSGTITLTSGLAMTNASEAAVQGQATFANLTFTERGTTQLTTTNSAGLTNTTSDNVVVEAAPRKRWDGGALTSNWSDAANWYPNGVPDQYDSVVLDNFYVINNYTVEVNTSGNTVGWLTIRPGVGKNDTLLIPSTNLADNALTVVGTSSVPSVKLHTGAVLTNEGLGTSGGTVYPFSITNGDLAIYTGGRYQHHTNRDHADLVSKLHVDTSTDLGIFEFDVPAAATTTYSLSLDGQSYGTLYLVNSSGLVTYDGGTGAGTVDIRGNLEVVSGAEFEPTVGTMNIGRDLAVAGLFDPSASTWVVMNGTVEQNISAVGDLLINKLELDNSSSTGIVLGSPVTLENTSAQLQMTDGYLYTTTTNILTLPTSATANGGSTQSFVHGPLYLVTAATSARNAPVGKDTLIRTVTITPSDANTDTFLIEYFYESPHLEGYDTSSRDATLGRVSGLEYWNVTQVSGSSDALVTLVWTEKSGVTPGYENEIRVAYWNGAKWDNKGGNPITGNADRGDVTTNPATSVFGIFTLGSLTDVNPLPVELLAFTAELQHSNVAIDWTTAMEMDNRGFAIQRSTDGENWEQIGWRDGHGTYMGELSYNYIDHNAAALGADVLYYRLKQVDYNGQAGYSEILSVRIDPQQFAVENAWINSSDGKLYFNLATQTDAKVNVMVMDVTGRTLFASAVDVNAGSNTNSVLLPELPEGVKLVTITNGNDSYTQKMLFR